MTHRLHIVAPDIHAGDAVGNHCIHLAKDLCATGLDVSIYAQRFTSDSVVIHPMEQVFDALRPDDRLLVSYSILDPYLERLLALKQRKIGYFHGVTPASLLREHEPVTADLCEKSVVQLPLLAGFDRLVFNSDFNRRDLSRYIPVESGVVIPPISPNFPQFLRPRMSSPANPPVVLVLGRVVPHKRLEHALELLHAIHGQGLQATLDIVGSCSNEVYRQFLIQEAERLGLSSHVRWLGMVDDEGLIGAYERASVLLSTSEHEGFCVPVLEAMHFGVPVVLRQGTAAQEIGANAALSFADLNEGAQQLLSALSDPALRGELVKLGTDRASALIRQASADNWITILDSL